MNVVFPDMALLGCVALLAYYMGRLARRFGVPPLLGYLVLGVLLGPSGIGVVTGDVLKHLSFITEVAIGFVAFGIGTGLNLSALRRQGVGITPAILGESLFGFVVVMVAVYTLTSDLPMALILGAIATACTTSIVHDGKDGNSLGKTLCTVVGFGNGLAVVIFVLAGVVVKTILLQEGVSGAAVLAGIARPIRGVLMSLLVGGVVGFGFCRIVRGVSNVREAVLVVFGSILLATGLSLWLNLSFFLTNMVVGFVVANTRGATLTPKVVEELRVVTPVLLVPFFCLAGAHLEVKLLLPLAAVAVVYIFGRTAGTVMGVSFGAALGNMGEKIRELLGLGILSQAGVAVGLALAVQYELGVVGGCVSDHAMSIVSSVVTVIVAAGIIFEIAGSFFARIAFRKAIETPVEQDQQSAAHVVVSAANGERKKPKAEWLAVRGFALVIIAGMLLLCLPISSADHRWSDPLTALFTSTSAVCVTGLSVVDIGSYFSRFGQIVLLCLMETGGLGVMTLGTFLLLLVGRRLTMRDEVVVMDSLGSERVRGLTSLICKIVLFAAVLELAGTMILAHRLTSVYCYSPHKAAYYGMFHAVSAFCNCGLSLYSDSLMGFRTDPVVVLTIAALIVLGGLGFLVLYNISSIKFWRRNRLLRGHLTLYAKIVLWMTSILIVGGCLGFLIFEWNNTLASLDWPSRILCALFQSVTPRTAGFNVVDMAAVRPSTLYSTIGLMFIGGSPGSTAGGIKTTTTVILLLSVMSMIKGRERIELGGRTISMHVVREALAVFLLGLFCVLICFGALLLTENLAAVSSVFSSSEKLLFETISAFGTVGLSTGITSQLSAVGKLCIILCMFVGRVGPLTIALIVGAKDIHQAVRYPEEEVMVG